MRMNWIIHLRCTIVWYNCYINQMDEWNKKRNAFLSIRRVNLKKKEFCPYTSVCNHYMTSYFIMTPFSTIRHLSSKCCIAKAPFTVPQSGFECLWIVSDWLCQRLTYSSWKDGLWWNVCVSDTICNQWGGHWKRLQSLIANMRRLYLRKRCNLEHGSNLKRDYPQQ